MDTWRRGAEICHFLLLSEVDADMDGDVPTLKTEVRQFWDMASCGEVYAEGPTTELRFRKHAEAR
jgi:hypothetical protein